MGIFSFFKKKKTQENIEKKQQQEVVEENIENKSSIELDGSKKDILLHQNDLDNQKITYENEISKDSKDLGTLNKKLSNTDRETVEQNETEIISREEKVSVNGIDLSVDKSESQNVSKAPNTTPNLSKIDQQQAKIANGISVEEISSNGVTDSSAANDTGCDNNGVSYLKKDDVFEHSKKTEDAKKNTIGLSSNLVNDKLSEANVSEEKIQSLDAVEQNVSAKDDKERAVNDSSASEKLSELETETEDVKISSQKSEKNDSDDSKVKPSKVSFFERLKRTRDNLAMGLSALVSGKKIDEDLYEELETALLTADLGVETTTKVIERLRTESKLGELKDASALKINLKNILKEILKPCAIPLNIEKVREDLPFVILMVGVNGAGKTTTIGKLALKYKDQGKKVMLAAGDTFRAAAVEQLKAWGDRTNTPVISQPTGSDSASVIFDALNAAIARHMDVLICDTAGRLQNKENLMEELKKIVRVMKKIDESVPNEVLLVLDATTGQNAVSQLKIFGDAVNVSGLALTKLDGTAKGGVTFSLADKFKIPLRYVGIGESKEDLREFDIDNFVDALFE
jgi:fused signal recognition particle receptor